MVTDAHRKTAINNRRIAMSHPLRAEILKLLVERGPASPVQLGRILKERTENVSHHCKRLVKLDCAELASTRQRRGATEHIYRATERSLVSTEEWDSLHPTESHRIKADIVQGLLDDFVETERNQLAGLDSDFHMTRTPMDLDEDGLREGQDVLERARLELMDIQRKSAERSAQNGSGTFRAASGLLLFRTTANH